MNIKSLIAMVGDQSNGYLLEPLSKESDLLQEQRLLFPEAFPFRDYILLRNYEIAEYILRRSAFPLAYNHNTNRLYYRAASAGP